jgi:DNA-3-methyladenine glycosylase
MAERPTTRALLPRSFFERDVVIVARDLVGRHIVRDDVVLRITEVEAYRGPKDSAAHSRAGNTARTAPMFGPAGHAYVYLCYGIHWMLNLVTGGRGEGQAILVRSCDVLAGFDTVIARRKRALSVDLVAGPGKVGQALALDATWNRHDVCSPGGLEVHAGTLASPELLVGPRVGIDFATPKDRSAPLRFALAGCKAITVPATLRRLRRKT